MRCPFSRKRLISISFRPPSLPAACCAFGRPRTTTELAFLSLGPVAERFLRAAAAAGTLRLEHELAELVALEAAWGRALLLQALERATRFRRFKATDVRAILAQRHGLPRPVPGGMQLELALPMVPERPLSAYALDALGVSA